VYAINKPSENASSKKKLSPGLILIPGGLHKSKGVADAVEEIHGGHAITDFGGETAAPSAVAIGRNNPDDFLDLGLVPAKPGIKPPV
jgi:hypothetical protein